MPYKKGDKFTIEITDVMTGGDGKTVYRMNDFSSLVFDDKGLDRLDRLEEKVVEPEKKSPFSRVGYGNEYYIIQPSGRVVTNKDTECSVDRDRFRAANYCTDKSLMEQRALHETLNRLLWRYSEEHGGDAKWNGINKHWVIAWNPVSEQVEEHYVTLIKENGNVYFNSQLSAIGAIREVVEPFLEEHPEFVW